MCFCTHNTLPVVDIGEKKKRTSCLFPKDRITFASKPVYSATLVLEPHFNLDPLTGVLLYQSSTIPTDSLLDSGLEFD